MPGDGFDPMPTKLELSQTTTNAGFGTLQRWNNSPDPLVSSILNGFCNPRDLRSSRYPACYKDNRGMPVTPGHSSGLVDLSEAGIITMWRSVTAARQTTHQPRTTDCRIAGPSPEPGPKLREARVGRVLVGEEVSCESYFRFPS